MKYAVFVGYHELWNSWNNAQGKDHNDNRFFVKLEYCGCQVDKW